ncbi:hypothetical protein, partial [Streptomyces turgidiscabies]
MIQVITKDQAPALGDVRTMGQGDALVLGEEATQRKDWGRYLDALGRAITNGAEVYQLANVPARWVLG